MGLVEKIEAQVEALEPEDAKRFAVWFSKWRADRWEDEIEHDVNAGKLDGLLKQARKEVNAGNLKPL